MLSRQAESSFQKAKTCLPAPELTPMALENLKIFVKIYDLLRYFHKEIAGFPKSEKPVLGRRIYDSLLGVLEYIITANEETSKIYYLKKASVELEKLRIFIRLSNDFHLISIKKYGIVSKRINEIGKMLGGWIKVCAKRA